RRLPASRRRRRENSSACRAASRRKGSISRRAPRRTCRPRSSPASPNWSLPPVPLQPVDEPLGQPHPDLVLLAGILDAVVEIGIVVHLDDMDAVGGFLEIDAIEAIADATGGAHGRIDRKSGG